MGKNRVMIVNRHQGQGKKKTDGTEDARMRKRQSLWHPADAPMDIESRKLGVA